MSKHTSAGVAAAVEKVAPVVEKIGAKLWDLAEISLHEEPLPQPRYLRCSAWTS